MDTVLSESSSLPRCAACSVCSLRLCPGAVDLLGADRCRIRGASQRLHCTVSEDSAVHSEYGSSSARNDETTKYFPCFLICAFVVRAVAPEFFFLCRLWRPEKSLLSKRFFRTNGSRYTHSTQSLVLRTYLSEKSLRVVQYFSSHVFLFRCVSFRIVSCKS